MFIEKNALGNNKIFDYKTSSLGAVIMGSIVYYINSEYGIEAASIAAAKQSSYTFLAGGFFLKMSENLATYFESETVTKLSSVVLPSALTIALTYGIHALKGTPEPFASTLPTIATAPPGFIWWSNKKRKQLENILIKEKNL